MFIPVCSRFKRDRTQDIMELIFVLIMAVSHMTQIVHLHILVVCRKFNVHNPFFTPCNMAFEEIELQQVSFFLLDVFQSPCLFYNSEKYR